MSAVFVKACLFEETLQSSSLTPTWIVLKIAKWKTIKLLMWKIVSINAGNESAWHINYIYIYILRLSSDELIIFVTNTIIQSITSSEMCFLHLTHPSAHTPGAVGSRHCGARGAVGGSVPCSRVSPQSWTIPAGAEIRTHNLGLQVQRSIH